MKLKDYIKQLKKLESKYGNVELYYSIDDEGNGYDAVKFGPCVMHIAKEDIPEYGNVPCVQVVPSVL